MPPLQEAKLQIVKKRDVHSMWGEKEVDSSFKGASEKSGGILIMWKISVINLIYSFMSDGFVGLSALWKNRQIYLVNIYSSCLLQKKIAL